MPRPNLKSVRREEILDATERCVARFGVEGTTLDKIAEAADMARPLIRHNLGNRDEIMAALVERFVLRSNESTSHLGSITYIESGPHALITALFSETNTGDQSILVAQALNIAAANDEMLARQMRDWTEQFIQSITKLLCAYFPKSSESACEEVAIGISGIYLSTATFDPLNPDPKYRQGSIKMASLLVDSLA